MTFDKLWKVKVLKEVLRVNKEEKFKGTITRDESSSIERDLRMIRYGYENGLKENKK